MAFLNNKNRCVIVNGKRSRQVDVTSDIIHGIILDPLSFTLYINDLPPTCEDSIIKLFTDIVKI